MSIWLCIPSARPPEEAAKCLSLWRGQGYKIALWRDEFDLPRTTWASLCDFGVGAKMYPGYAMAANVMVKQVLARDASCDWCVVAGDDTEPDATYRADEIARECSRHFADVNTEHLLANPPANAQGLQRSDLLFSRRASEYEDDLVRTLPGATFGVCQPTGDRFAGGSIERICGSPWIGRDFALRINQGRGPFWPEYTHMFADEELQNVALKYGVLWQRRDLIHLHHHFQRESTALNSNAVTREMPEHLKEANSPEHWKKYRTLFRERQGAGFPGSEPL